MRISLALPATIMILSWGRRKREPAVVESRLLAAYQQAYRVHALARTELEQTPTGEFAAILERVDKAQQAVEAARSALDAFRNASRVHDVLNEGLLPAARA